MSDGKSSLSAYLQSSHGREVLSAYLSGKIIVNWVRIPAYLLGGSSSSSDTSVYLSGSVLISDSQSAYIVGPAETVNKSVSAYCSGMTRSSIHAYIGEGLEMAQVDYIWLKTSDSGATLSKKFRVLQQDYDDGTLEKAENINRTIGGGVDHSVGGVYMTWSMVIRVRHTETETDYGNKDDLEYLWGLNNPNGTPSNDITFIDHHQVQYTVHTVGKLTKNLLGCQVEGECAWYLYKIKLMRVQ